MRSWLQQRACSAAASSGQSTSPIFQFSASCHAEQLRAAGGVRLVDEAEVGLEPVEHAGVGAEQRAVGLRAATRAPSCHQASSSSAATCCSGTWRFDEVGEQRVELEVAQRRRAARCAPAGSASTSRLGGEAGELRAAARRSASSAASCRRAVQAERARRGARGLRRRAGRRPARRRCRSAPRAATPADGEALPQDALLLDARRLSLQVGDVHARAARTRARACLQAAAVRARHVGRVAPRRRSPRSSSASERSKTTGWNLSSVSRIVEQQAQVDAELGDRLEGAHPGLADQRRCARSSRRGRSRAVQVLGELVRGVAGADGRRSEAPYQGESSGP